MKEIRLWRLPCDLPFATFGVFTHDKVPFCVSVELPWQDNKNDISCIPAGTYICRRRAATERIPYEHFLITNVPGREGCAIHRANWASQLRGCVAPAEAFEILADKPTEPGAADSKGAFDELMAFTKGLDEFRLHIVNLKEEINA